MDVHRLRTAADDNNHWEGRDAEALRFMAATRRRFLGVFSWIESLTVHDREMRPVLIDVHISVLRDIARQLPARASQVETLIGKLEAARGGLTR